MITMRALALLLITFLPLSACSEGASPATENPSPKDKYAHVNSFRECVKAGLPIMRSLPAQCATPDGRVFIDGQSPSASGVLCKNRCGNGICEQIVCEGEGCPCAESPRSCPEDCTVSLEDW